jgi:hypothetical protein
LRNSVRRLLVTSAAALAAAAVAAPSAHAATGTSHHRHGTQGSLTSKATSSPAAIPNRRDDMVAVVGGDNALWVRSTTTGFHSLGGILVDTPTIVRGNGVDYFLGLGADHNVWIRTADLAWQPLGPKGTNCAGPSGLISVDTLAVACRGGDNGLWVAKVPVPTNGALPKLGGFANYAGKIKGGVAIADGADYSATTPVAYFYYLGVGSDSTPWYRGDADSWAPDDPAVCGGDFSTTEFGDIGVCRNAGGTLQVVTYGAGAPVVKTIPSGVLGRPAVSSDDDGVTRFYVLGTDGNIYLATSNSPDGTGATFTRWDGAGKYGVAATNYSTYPAPTTPAP